MTEPTRIVNAVVWTGRRGLDGTTVVRDAVAFADGRITALGEAAHRAPAEQVIDAAGGFIGPAFADGHCHPIFGGLEAEFAPVSRGTTPGEVADIVAAWVRQHPDLTWVRGEGFDPTIATAATFRAEWLDAVVPDRPVVLRASDYHTVWVNSAALAAVGYRRGVAQPAGGEIVLDEAGEPVGTLREGPAWRPLYDLLPPVDDAVRVAALRRAAQAYADLGVTWVQDAWVEPADIETWLAAGPLPVGADLALWVDPQRWRDQVEGFTSNRRRVTQDARDSGLTAGTVKIFADGVVESGTAALREPYADCPHSHGLANWTPDALAAAVGAFDAEGFGIHVHAIGDAAIAMTLDAFEGCLLNRPATPRRWTLAHAQVVDPRDLPRFADLGVVANLEPLWAMNDPCQELLTTPRLGSSRSTWQYPMASLLRSGADLSFGSDWPISSAAPLEGVRTAVTRQAGRDTDPWLPHERITVDDALRAYTLGVARQAGHKDAGVVRPGAVADLVWLGADPRSVEPFDIGDIAVLGTWRGGVRTH